MYYDIPYTNKTSTKKITKKQKIQEFEIGGEYFTNTFQTA